MESPVAEAIPVNLTKSDMLDRAGYGRVKELRKIREGAASWL
jgi:hypothetical protein